MASLLLSADEYAVTATAGMRSPPRARTRRMSSNAVSPGSPMSATITWGRRSAALSSTASASSVEPAVPTSAPYLRSICTSTSRQSPSSSTTSSRQPTSARESIEGWDVGASSRSASMAGNVMVKVDPALAPGLAAVIWPPCSSTSCRTSARPRPSPPSVRLTDESACRNRSKTNGRKSGAMPLPGVLDDQAHRAVLLIDPHRDRAAARRELDGIRQHVPRRSAAPGPASPMISRGRVPSTVWIVMFLAGADGRDDVDRRGGRCHEIDGRRTRGAACRVTMRAMSSMSSISRACATALRSMTSQRARHHLGSTFWPSRMLRPAEHRVQRRAQLVRQRGQELVLHAQRVFGGRRAPTRPPRSGGASRPRC